MGSKGIARAESTQAADMQCQHSPVGTRRPRREAAARDPMRSKGIGRRRVEEGPHAKRGEPTSEAEKPATMRCVEIAQTIRSRPRAESTQAADMQCQHSPVAQGGRGARPASLVFPQLRFWTPLKLRPC